MKATTTAALILFLAGAAELRSQSVQASSIADLRTLPPTVLTDGLQVPVAGYYAPGDGGGGTYIYRPLEGSAPDGGAMIAATAAGGRFQLQIIDSVSVRQFGARGDGVADDTGALNRSVAYAVRRGVRLHIPAGRFKVNGPLAARGSLQMEGDGPQCILDGSGRLLNGPDGPFDAGWSLEEAPAFGNAIPFTEPISAGQTSYRLPRADGLSIGRQVFLDLGTDPFDRTQAVVSMYATIVGISGTTISVDKPCPENITHDAGGPVTGSLLYPVEAPVRNWTVRNLTLDLLPLHVDAFENGLVENLYVPRGNIPFSFSRCTGLTMRHVVAGRIYGAALYYSGKSGPFYPYGVFIGGLRQVGLHVEDVVIHNLDSCPFFSSEAQPRDMAFNDIHIAYSFTSRSLPRNTNLFYFTNNTPRATSPYYEAVFPTISNLYLVDLNPAAADAAVDLPDNATYSNVAISGWGGAAAHPGYEPQDPSTRWPEVRFDLARLTSGWLKFKNRTYTHRRSFRLGRLLEPNATATLKLPAGLLASLSAFTTSTRGIQRFTANTGDDRHQLLVANRFVDLGEDCTTIAQGGANYTGAHGALSCVIVTDGTLPPGTYLEVEGSVLLDPAGLGPDEAADPRVHTFRGPPSQTGADTPSTPALGWDYANRQIYMLMDGNGSPNNWLPLTARWGGTFTLASGAAAVQDPRVTSRSTISFGLSRKGGTISQAPYLTSMTPGSGFTVRAGDSDTSTYTYAILDHD